MCAHSRIPIDVMVSGGARSFCQASQAASMMAWVAVEDAV